ncbi:GntR family transcriptional regulator [Luteimonas sp. FXH3W]|uniref:GntR family transcriptional regulator n=1 Tax=Aquilutibacter rugosus TaxID=3115820 RepID=A0ABU7V074_9GAMM
MSAVQWNDSAPIFLQLKQRIIAMMLSGELKPGDALPSVRQVASDYQVNPITVSRSYQELVQEGLVEKRRGIGMFVTESATGKLLSAEREHFLTVEWPHTLERMHQLGIDPASLLQDSQQRFGKPGHE